MTDLNRQWLHVACVDLFEKGLVLTAESFEHLGVLLGHIARFTRINFHVVKRPDARFALNGSPFLRPNSALFPSALKDHQRAVGPVFPGDLSGEQWGQVAAIAVDGSRSRNVAKLEQGGDQVEVGRDPINLGSRLDHTGKADEAGDTRPPFVDTPFTTFHVAVVAIGVGPIVGQKDHDRILFEAVLFEGIQESTDVVVDVLAHRVSTPSLDREIRVHVSVPVRVGHLPW